MVYDHFNFVICLSDLYGAEIPGVRMRLFWPVIIGSNIGLGENHAIRWSVLLGGWNQSASFFSPKCANFSKRVGRSHRRIWQNMKNIQGPNKQDVWPASVLLIFGRSPYQLLKAAAKWLKTPFNQSIFLAFLASFMHQRRSHNVVQVIPRPSYHCDFNWQ